jgi:phosphoserine phosphatase RsbU/P
MKGVSPQMAAPSRSKRLRALPPTSSEAFRSPDGIGEIEQLRRLQRVSDAALAHLGLEDLLDELLLRVREVLSADTAAVLLLDEETREVVVTASAGLEEAVARGVRIPLGKGFAGRIAAEAKVVVIRRVDKRNVLNPFLRQAGVRSLLGAPLVAEGRVIGVVHVGSLEERDFTEWDKELLQFVADRVALAIHVRLYEHERAVVGVLQRGFLPEALPTVAGLRVSAGYIPASSAVGVGGDWYDAFTLPDGRLSLAIGDVAGHGLHAAMVMGKIRNAVRAIAFEGASPAKVVARVDRLVNYFEPSSFVTFLYGVINAELNGFRFVSAGHPPPLLVSPGGSQFLEWDLGRNPPLGVGNRDLFHEHRVSLREGSSLLLYTDGLVERSDESLGIGLERLLAAAKAQLLGSKQHDPIGALVRTVGPSKAADDIALLLIERKRSSPEASSSVPSQLGRDGPDLRSWISHLSLPEAPPKD